MGYMRSSSLISFQIANNIFLGYGSKQQKVTAEQFELIRRLIEYLNQPKQLEEISAFMEREGIDEDILTLCLDNRYITDNEHVFYPQDTTRYKNHLYVDMCFSNPQKVINGILGSTIINIGCGGIGNYLLYALAGFSPKHIFMFDGDVVSRSNLNRQILFSIPDIGKYKTDVIKREISARFPEIYMKGYNVFATGDIVNELLNTTSDISHPLLIISGDNEDTVKVITALASEMKIPCLNLGYLNDYSVIGPFYIPGVSACPFCSNIGSGYRDNHFDNLKEFNAHYRAPSSYINSSMAASMAVIDIMHYFNGDYSKINSFNKRVGISNLDFKRLELPVSRRGECVVCGNHEKK